MRKSIRSMIISYFLVCLTIYLIDILTNTKPSVTEKSILSNDDYIRCLLDAHEVLELLSLRWFLTYGTALSYWRSKNFVSHDIDIGIFSDDLYRQRITDDQLVSTMIKKFNFKFLRRFGEINHGQEWTFVCPQAHINFDIFVFYHLNETSDYWSATYTGLCDKMRYKKCRWKFRKFQINFFEIYKKRFYIVPLTFIKERYGKNYSIKRDYGYGESLKFLPNLIEEYDYKNINLLELANSFAYKKKIRILEYFFVLSILYIFCRFSINLFVY